MLKTDSALLTDHVENKLRQMITKDYGVLGGKLPQQQDLANQFGVSMITIRAALDRLRCDKLIKSIRGSGTFVVTPSQKFANLIVLTNASSPYVSMAVETIGTILRGKDLHLSLVISDDPVVDYERIQKGHSDIAGIVVVGVFSLHAMERLVQISQVPVVLIGDLGDRPRSRIVCNNVAADARSLSYRATEYMIQQGHHKVALLVWERDKVWSRDSILGHDEALADNNIEPHPDWIIELKSNHPAEEYGESHLLATEQKIGAIMDRWSQQNNAPTALVCPSARESQITDIVHLFFHDHFQSNNIIFVATVEQIKAHYTGIRDAVAVCSKYEDLARRAIEILLSPSTDDGLPRREVQDKTYLYRRSNGVWRESR